MKLGIYLALGFLSLTACSSFAQSTGAKDTTGLSQDEIDMGVRIAPHRTDEIITGEGIEDLVSAWKALQVKAADAGNSIEPMRCFSFWRTLIFENHEAMLNGDAHEAVRISILKYRVFPPDGCTVNGGFLLNRRLGETDWTCVESNSPSSPCFQPE